MSLYDEQQEPLRTLPDGWHVYFVNGVEIEAPSWFTAVDAYYMVMACSE